MTPTDRPAVEAMAGSFRDYTAMRYAGDCKCGACQLVPRDDVVASRAMLLALLERAEKAEAALTIAIRRGCSHCADDIREARALAQKDSTP